jgi:hypothetical protein
VLVIRGGQDVVIPERWARELPGGTLVIVRAHRQESHLLRDGLKAAPSALRRKAERRSCAARAPHLNDLPALTDCIQRAWCADAVDRT